MILALAVLTPLGAGLACAETGDFELVYPTVSYFQFQDPTFIAANDQYLAVYDSAIPALFVRGNLDNSTYSFSIDIQNVKNVFTVGKFAVVVAKGSAEDDEYFSIDLSAKDSSFEPLALSTPEHISSLSSDGNRLYAKSTGGYLTVYDDSLAPVDGLDNVYNSDALSGYAVCAAQDGKLYLLGTDEKNDPRMSVFDTASKTASIVEGFSSYVQQAFVGEVIYARISDNEEIVNRGKLLVLDKATGEQMFVSEAEFSNFCAYGKYLYMAKDGRITVYALSENKQELIEQYTISMAGSDLNHLNAPSDLVRYGSRLAVADSANDRVAFIDLANGNMSPVKFSGTPIRVTASEDDVYALLADGKIQKITQNATSQELVTLEGAKDIAYLGSLYAVTDEGVYSMFMGNMSQRVSLVGAKRLYAANNNLYVLTPSKIVALSKDCNVLYTVEKDMTGVEDFAVDYAGNFYLLYENRIEKYQFDFENLELVSQYSIKNATVHAKANSMTIKDDSIYFTADECLIGKLAADVTTKDNFVEKEPTLGELTPKLAKLKDDAESFVCPKSGNVEEISYATNETLLIVCESSREGFSYALRGNELIIVRTADYDLLEPEKLPDKDGARAVAYFASAGAQVYAVPYLTSPSSIAEKTLVEAYSLRGYDDDKWVYVTFGDTAYYMDKNSLTSTLQNEQPENKKVVGKAKADRVGGLVSVYSDESFSTSLKEIVDGTKVEVLEEFENSYLVSYKGVVGYMKKDEVAIDSLTTVQLVSIILSVVIALAGVGIFLAIYLTRQHSESQKK